MIVCRTCGGHNADSADFCGSCGEFLEWTGEKLASESAQPPIAESTPAAPQPKPTAPQPKPTAPPPTAPPPTAPKPAVTGFRPAVSGFTPAVSGSGPPASGSRPAAAVSRPPASGSGPAVAGSGLAVTPSQPAVASVKPATSEPPSRAAEALVAPLPPDPGPNRPSRPIPDPGPVARRPQPAEMRPQAPVRRRPTAPTAPTAPTRELQPDDLICGLCGEGNPPTRRFCSRCGESLQTAAAVPAPPVPWWRKILNKFVEREVHPAGARPKRRFGLLTLRGVTRALRRTLLVALLLAGLLYAVFPSMRGLVHGLVTGGKDRVESLIVKPVPVRPLTVDASGALPEHPATEATDGLKNTFWAAPDAGAQPTLVVTFERATRLVHTIVFNGDGAGEDFQALSRARELNLVYSDGDRIIGASRVSLTDTPGEQQVDLSGGDGATRVEIKVLSVYGTQSPAVALSEIEFFERQ